MNNIILLYWGKRVISANENNNYRDTKVYNAIGDTINNNFIRQYNNINFAHTKVFP